MSLDKLLKLADDLNKKLKVDPSIVIEEHKDVYPVSYMGVANLENIIKDSKELLEILNSEDDLPQWVDQELATAKTSVAKALDYIRSQKTESEKLAQTDRLDLIKLAKGKYDHIDFKPSESAASAATRGLELRKKNKGKGGLSAQQAGKQGIGSGVARAVSLKNRQTLSPSTVRRMKAFFDRHEKNKGASGDKPLSQDKGYIAWLLWGGDPGRAWANKVCRQMDAADEKSK